MSDLTLRVPAEPENVIVVRELIRGVERLLAVRPGLGEAVLTAVSEAANNVVIHAYDGVVGPLEVDVSLGGPLEVRVRDRGLGFDPLLISDEEDDSGLGQAVIAAFVDDVQVTSRPGEGSEVRLRWAVPSLVRDGNGDVGEGLRGETVLCVPADPIYSGATGRVLLALGARARLPVDRLNDLQLIGDTLLAHSRPVLAGRRLSLAFVRGRGRIDVVAGPYVGGGAGSVRRARAVGGRPLIERLAQDVSIARDRSGARETLRFSVGDRSVGDG